MITAQVVLINSEGMVLGVSRKNDHNDFGLPGGKMDPEDNGDPMVTAIRECKEETGLDITNLRLIFAIHKSGNMGHTYLADYSGEINHDEPHVVKWVTFQNLIAGSFGKYNKLVSESLLSMGVDFKMIVDKDELVNELNEFMETQTFNGFKVSVKDINTTPIFQTSASILFLNNINPETCEFDDEFTQGLNKIGLKHGLNIQVPSYYYSK